MTAVERVRGGPQGVVRPGAIHEGMSWRCNPLSSPPARGRDQNAMTMRQCPPPRCALRGAWIHDRHDPDRASPRRAAPPKSRASPATDRWLAAPDARRRRPHGLRRDRRRRPGRGDHPRRHVGRPPRPDRARQARLRRADDRLRPRRQGRARPVRGRAPARRRLRRRSRSRSSTRRPRPRTGPSGTTPASTPAALVSAVAENASGAERARRLDHHPAARPRPPARPRTSSRPAPTGTSARSRRSSRRFA